MEDSNISYTFFAKNTIGFLQLLAFCLFEFLLLIIVFGWWLITFWQGGGFSLVLNISLLIVLPILTFYFFRNRSCKEVTVVLSTIKIEIQWAQKERVIFFEDIKSYSASRLYQETGDIERICIRLKNGKKIRFSATAGLCDIEPLREFREAFDKHAQRLKLPHKITWEEKWLKKS